MRTEGKKERRKREKQRERKARKRREKDEASVSPAAPATFTIGVETLCVWLAEHIETRVFCCFIVKVAPGEIRRQNLRKWNKLKKKTKILLLVLFKAAAENGRARRQNRERGKKRGEKLWHRREGETESGRVRQSERVKERERQSQTE